MRPGRWLGVSGVLLVLGAFAVLAIGRTSPDRREVTHPRTPAPVGPRISPEEAAVRFLAGLRLDVLLDPRRRHRFIAEWAAPGHIAKLQQLYASEAERIDHAYAAEPRVARAAFLGYRTHENGQTAAEVTLWAVSVGGASDSRVAVGWRTMRVSLTATGGDWKVMAVKEEPGPSPDMSVAELARAAATFQELRVAP